MSIYEKINALGDPIHQHHFTGRFQGVAAALYPVDGSDIGTHFVAVIEADGPTQILPIMSEVGARNAYAKMIHAVHAEQDAA